MSLIDRILNGDFDDEQDSVPSVRTSSLRGSEGTKPRHTDPTDEPLEDEEEDMTEEEFEDIPSEEVDDEEPDVIMEADSDIPSDEWMKEYAAENGLDLEEPEPALAAPTQYVEKPKQSKVREINKNKNMTTENTNTPAENTPKHSTTKTSTDAKKRGAPYKLTEHAEEVCRLYNEGVGAKTIAEKFGVSVSCVINTLKRNNIAIRPKGRRKTND
jgi:hypothetical protein